MAFIVGFIVGWLLMRWLIRKAERWALEDALIVNRPKPPSKAEKRMLALEERLERICAEQLERWWR